MRRLVLLLIGLALMGCERSNGRPSEPAASDGATSPSPSSVPEAVRVAPPGEAQARFEARRTERAELVRTALDPEGITDPRVLSAMRRVPRHEFVPEAVRGSAYQDRPLPIGWGQTISQPYIVAAMTQAVAPKPTDRCLEIGTGSGYQAAVLAEVCGSVYSIEYIPALARFAAQNLGRLGYRVSLRTGDGYRGWPEAAPFDVVVVTAAPEEVPAPLLSQLAIKGRLAIPVGPEDGVQTLQLWTRTAPGDARSSFEREDLLDVRFVPFLGEARER